MGQCALAASNRASLAHEDQADLSRGRARPAEPKLLRHQLLDVAGGGLERGRRILCDQCAEARICVDLVIDRFDRRHAAPRIAPDVVGAEENAPPAPAPR